MVWAKIISPLWPQSPRKFEKFFIRTHCRLFLIQFGKYTLNKLSKLKKRLSGTFCKNTLGNEQLSLHTHFRAFKLSCTFLEAFLPSHTIFEHLSLHTHLRALKPSNAFSSIKAFIHIFEHLSLYTHFRAFKLSYTFLNIYSHF